MKPVGVEIEILTESGEVEHTISAQVCSVRDNLVFLYGAPEGPYCIGGDECEGYWCCDPSSQERLSRKSIEVCRLLQESKR